MLKQTFLILYINFWLAKSAPTVPNKDTAEITKFHVNSRIQLRYAITDVETQIRNRHSEPKEIIFDIYIPQEAFVSNFSMVIKDKTYQAKGQLISELFFGFFKSFSWTDFCLASKMGQIKKLKTIYCIINNPYS